MGDSITTTNKDSNRGMLAPAADRREIRMNSIVRLRAQGYSNQKIADEVGCSVGTVWMDLKAALTEQAKMRQELGELILEDTLNSYQRIEQVIVSRSRINIIAAIELAKTRLIKARETSGVVSGKTAREWEIEVTRLTDLEEETGGLENEDLDRLKVVRDKISALLGVEPPKKMAVEHTFVMQAKDAQQRLRDRLGLGGPVPATPEPIVQDAEVMDQAETGEEEADPIRS